MSSKKLSISVCVPVYKGSLRLKTAMDSISDQGFDGRIEIIVGDDNPPDQIEEIKKTKSMIDTYKNLKIRYYKNRTNLGSALNIRKLSALAKNDILFFLCQDDVLARDALERTHDAFLLDEDVGVVTRPFFCFTYDTHVPVRVVEPIDQNRDTIVSLEDGKESFMKIFHTVGQISGLAYRRKFLTTPFGEECFSGHIYPFAAIFRDHTCVFLKDYTVAVGIFDSQTRHVSSIYDQSPLYSWIKMFQSVFAGEANRKYRNWGIEHIAGHYVGLIQLKNYAKKGVLEKEIIIMVRYHWQNIFHPKFWFYSLMALIVPRRLLRFLTDWYKAEFNSRMISKIIFRY